MAPSTVLIADDDEIIRRLAARVLAASGHRCAVAGGARELAARARAEPPDLVVADVDLGDGDGVEVCLRLREERPALAVVLITGNGAHAARARAAGLGAVLLKPFDVAELEKAVADALR